MHKIHQLFLKLWLPVFLLLATTWLFAPWLHGVRVGHLAVISIYESLGGVYNLFRVADLLAAVLLIVALYVSKMWRRDKVLAWLIGLYAVLSILDIVFTAGCDTAGCSLVQQVNHYAHDIESSVSAVILVVAAGYDYFRNKRRSSGLFAAVQILLGLVIAVGIFDHNTAMTSQFIYQAAGFVWLGTTVGRFYPRPAISARQQTVIRRLLGGWAALSGVLSILSSLHTHFIEHLSRYGIAGQDIYLAQHGLITGVLLLYLARHVAQGQRRAAWLMQALLVGLIIKYSLFEPRPLPLLLSLIASLALLYGWTAFNRNSVPSRLSDRLQDAVLVLAGALAAILLFVGLLNLHDSRHHVPLRHTVPFSFDRAAERERHHRAESHDIRIIISSLTVTALLAAAWGLFRPAGIRSTAQGIDTNTVTGLLEKHARSSEDYFKLWPRDKQYFTLDDRPAEGFIAYRPSGGTVFALPGPIGPAAMRSELLRSFDTYCSERGLSICFMAVEASDRSWYESFGYNTLQIGSSALIKVEQFATETVREKWWRWQLNRARKQGFQFEICTPPHSQQLLREVQHVSDAWLTRPGHSEQGFALGSFNETYLQAGRLLLLHDEAGRLIAFANELPVFNGIKTATVDLIRFLPDQNGAMPVLIAEYIQNLHTENRFTHFDLGFVPLAKLDSRLGRAAKRILQSRFSAAGLEQFKSKFKPDWQPVYIAYYGDLINLAGVMLNLEKVLDNHDAEIEPSNA